MLDFELYRPTDLELWIEQKYEAKGICTVEDMKDLDRIASLFGAHIAFTAGETKVIYDEDGDCMIFLNIHMDKYEQRAAFFHELCHPALHSGNQRSLPTSFVSLQESQAGLFQQYAAMPLGMLKEFMRHTHDVPSIADAFMLPHSFVRIRLERIARRIHQQREDRVLRERLSSASSAPPLYSDTTRQLLIQLHRQTYHRRGEERQP